MGWGRTWRGASAPHPARGIAADRDRHLILVTATPHSGNESAFRSLLTLLDPDFTNLPEDLSGPRNESHRRRLAAHFVQRRRGDICHYMQADTPFPEREEGEETYKLTADYKRLFEKVLAYARDGLRSKSGDRAPAAGPVVVGAGPVTVHRVQSCGGSRHAADPGGHRRHRFGRRGRPGGATDGHGSGRGRNVRSVGPVAGSDPGEDADESGPLRSRLLAMAKEAEALQGRKDAKLQKVTALVEAILKDGFHPILFCRFIPTAEYVAAALRDKFKGVEVVAVTGTLPPIEREYRVAQLAQAERRVLVCTDCLSEGINLQQHFNAVVHYDLSWNPTRHEQREGRVDRYGQPSPKIRAVTYYGLDNQIDGIVLNVLLRKHKAIRSSLGVSIPLPTDSDQVIQAVFEGLLLRGRPARDERLLPGFEEFVDQEERTRLHQQWEASSEREKRSRTVFAQESIKVEEVTQELVAAREAIGSGVDVAAFTRAVLQAYRASVRINGAVQVDLTEAHALCATCSTLDNDSRPASRCPYSLGNCCSPGPIP